jgi:hypothetical protein
MIDAVRYLPMQPGIILAEFDWSRG